MGAFKTLHTLTNFDGVKRYLITNNCTYIRRYFVWRKQFNVYIIPQGFDKSFLKFLSPHFGYKIKGNVLIVSKNLKEEDYKNPILWDFDGVDSVSKKVIKTINTFKIKFSKLQQIYSMMNNH